MAMLRRSSEHPLSGSPSGIQTRGLESAERAPEPTAESQTPLERKMSSQSSIQANASQLSRAGASLETLARPVIDGLSAFARRFRNALCESRQQEANQVLRRYRHLIDRSSD
jgi:hypothetical protein